MIFILFAQSVEPSSHYLNANTQPFIKQLQKTVFGVRYIVSLTLVAILI